MERAREYTLPPPRSAPGVRSMVGYRALDVPEGVHRGMPSSMLTFIVSLDDGVEAAELRRALLTARPNPLIHRWSTCAGQPCAAAARPGRRAAGGASAGSACTVRHAQRRAPRSRIRRGRGAWPSAPSNCATGWPTRTAGPTCSRWCTISTSPPAGRSDRTCGAGTVSWCVPEVAYAWHLLERSPGPHSGGHAGRHESG